MITIASANTVSEWEMKYTELEVGLHRRIEQLKSELEISEQKRRTTEEELNELKNNQYVNKNNTFSELKKPSKTKEMKVHDIENNRTIISHLENRNTILKGQGANLNKGKH